MHCMIKQTFGLSGRDENTIDMISMYCSAALPHLSHLINLCIRRSVFPEVFGACCGAAFDREC